MNYKDYFKKLLMEGIVNSESIANHNLNEVTSYTNAQRTDKKIARMEERHLQMLKRIAARFKENPDSVKSNVDHFWTTHRLMHMMRAKGYDVRLDDFNPKSSHSRFNPKTYPSIDELLSDDERADAARNANDLNLIKVLPARIKKQQAQIERIQRRNDQTRQTRLLAKRKNRTWDGSNN